jgi:hypothetical protein
MLPGFTSRCSTPAECAAASALADVVHRDDVWVIEARRGLRLLLEAALRLRVGQLDRQELDRDRAVQPRVGGAIDDAHAAAAEHFVDAVIADSRAGGERGCITRAGGAACPDVGRVLLRTLGVVGRQGQAVAR